MGLEPLEFAECLTNSTSYREKLHNHEKELERTSKAIKALFSDGKDVLAASKRLFYQTLLQFYTSLRTLLYLIILILLINIVSSEQNVRVHWNVSTPAVFGHNTKLTCHLEEISKNPEECQVRQWSGGPLNIEGLIYNGHSSDKKKYEEYINHHSFQFSLVIKNFAESDVNVNYTCSCGFFKSVSKKLVLEKHRFHFPPNGAYTHFAIHNDLLQVRLHMPKVYPKPNCSLMLGDIFIPEKAVNYSQNGDVFTVDYIAEYELKETDCGKQPIIICTFGNVAAQVSFEGNETNECLINTNATQAGNSSNVNTSNDQNMKSPFPILQIVLAVSATVIIAVMVVSYLKCKTRCQLRRKKDIKKDIWDNYNFEELPKS